MKIMPPRIHNFELKRSRWFMRLQFVDEWDKGFVGPAIGDIEVGFPG